MNWLFFALMICMSAVDQGMTYWTVSLVRQLHPKINWMKMELNPMVVFFWKRFGMKKGSMLASLFTFILLSVFVIYIFSSVQNELLYFMTGALTIVIRIHVHNILEIKKKIKQKMLLVQ